MALKEREKFLTMHNVWMRGIRRIGEGKGGRLRGLISGWVGEEEEGGKDFLSFLSPALLSLSLLSKQGIKGYFQ